MEQGTIDLPIRSSNPLSNLRHDPLFSEIHPSILLEVIEQTVIEARIVSGDKEAKNLNFLSPRDAFMALTFSELQRCLESANQKVLWRARMFFDSCDSDDLKNIDHHQYLNVYSSQLEPSDHPITDQDFQKLLISSKERIRNIILHVTELGSIPRVLGLIGLPSLETLVIKLPIFGERGTSIEIESHTFDHLPQLSKISLEYETFDLQHRWNLNLIGDSKAWKVLIDYEGPGGV